MKPYVRKYLRLRRIYRPDLGLTPERQDLLLIVIRRRLHIGRYARVPQTETVDLYGEQDGNASPVEIAGDGNHLSASETLTVEHDPRVRLLFTIQFAVTVTVEAAENVARSAPPPVIAEAFGLDTWSFEESDDQFPHAAVGVVRAFKASEQPDDYGRRWC